MKNIFIVSVFVLALSGCAHVRPIAFVGHESHADQHLCGIVKDFKCSNYGENVVGAGVRAHITRHLTMDVTEGARVFTGTQEWKGVPKETFDARLVYEF